MNSIKPSLLAPSQRIAVIGTGISGNLVARLLASRHDVQVYEANDYIGGHTNTVDVEAFGEHICVDTGFMVFNERTYPNFCRMLQLIGVDSQDSDMSFSVRCERSGLEYQGSSLNGLFAQCGNLVRPSFYRMLRDVFRFNRESVGILHASESRLTLSEYLSQNAYSRQFIDHYLVPMAAAIWSARPNKLLEFPAHFLIGFFRNHGLLQVSNRPQWKTITGGGRSYVASLTGPIQDRIHLSCPIESVTRHADHVVVKPQNESVQIFDQVVFASHADQTIAMLTDADEKELHILSAFPYQENEAVLHTDCSLLPRRKRAWASWNYHISNRIDLPVAVTYDLSRLQQVNLPSPILLTLNHSDQIDPAKVVKRFNYSHPAYGCSSIDAQNRHAEISGRRRTHFCGAYWGYGFHEDGVNSALAVAKHFGIGLEACTVASTKEKLRTADALQ